MLRTLLVPMLALAPFAAQGPQKLKPEDLHPNLSPKTDDQKEMIELFHKVEKKLGEIDAALYDAGAGGAVKGKLENAGIDELLKSAAAHSKEAQAGIDRIIEIARQQQQQQQQSSGSGQGEPKDQSGDSPLDKQRGDQPAEKDKKPGGKQPKPGDEQEQQKPNQPKDGQPKGNKDSKEDPKNRTGKAPPKGPTDHASVVDDRDRWGDLPLQVRDVFRVEGGGDLPPRYRDWIDAYYRRMNKRP